jgi:hypothetical protein
MSVPSDTVIVFEAGAARAIEGSRRRVRRLKRSEAQSMKFPQRRTRTV